VPQPLREASLPGAVRAGLGYPIPLPDVVRWDGWLNPSNHAIQGQLLPGIIA